MAREVNPWNKTLYDRVIRTKIGQGLREQYDEDLARPLPHKLSTLLMQLSEQENSERGRRPERNTAC
jgi:Anti-sigma factor NepR